MRQRLVLFGIAVMVVPAGLAGCAAPGAGRDDTLVVAAVSMETRVREIDRNVEHIEQWARKAAAAGAELVLFPETAISGWWYSRQIRAYGEPIDGPSITRLRRVAGELGMILAVGMTERDGDHAYITHVVFDGHGVIGKHRKTSLAPGEEKFWDPGDDANVLTVKGVKVGIAICYESVQPMTCAKLRENGARIVLAPYANGTDPDELLNGKRPYTYARAKENGVWYVACDAPAHEENGTLRRGAAYVISPQGELVAITPADATGETMVLYPIPLQALRDTSVVH